MQSKDTSLLFLGALTLLACGGVADDLADITGSSQPLTAQKEGVSELRQPLATAGLPAEPGEVRDELSPMAPLAPCFDTGCNGQPASVCAADPGALLKANMCIKSTDGSITIGVIKVWYSPMCGAAYAVVKSGIKVGSGTGYAVFRSTGENNSARAATDKLVTPLYGALSGSVVAAGQIWDGSLSSMLGPPVWTPLVSSTSPTLSATHDSDCR